MNQASICRIASGLALLTVLALGPLIPLGLAASAAESGSEKITLDFKDVDLTDLINTISELTGKNFLYDETVRGKVTIVSPETMTLAKSTRSSRSKMPRAKACPFIPAAGPAIPSSSLPAWSALTFSMSRPWRPRCWRP